MRICRRQTKKLLLSSFDATGCENVTETNRDEVEAFISTASSMAIVGKELRHQREGSDTMLGIKLILILERERAIDE